jgi:aminoglycoside phosphotransferase (APT) family kinase protein
VRKADITPELVARLVAEQFPRWAGLPVVPVDLDGWDNTTMRLGDEWLVRLPSHEAYVPQIAKEHEWLPRLAQELPLAIPQPEARGEPGSRFPRPWSVYRWLEGTPARPEQIDDLTAFARALAGFLKALQAIDTTGGPPPGAHSFDRGGPISTFDEQVQVAIEALAGELDAVATRAAWSAATAADAMVREPVWVHGDITGSNLLVAGGALSGVIDFGCSAVGDPACDLAIAWATFHGASRAAFLDELGADAALVARARGWALWKALLTLENARSHQLDPDRTAHRFGWRLGPRAVVDEVVGEHERMA